jgi:ferredoxin
VDYPQIARMAAGQGLAIFGGFHPVASDDCPDGTATMLLLCPDEPGFWPRMRTQPEMRQRAADPVDRWSTRVVSALAEALVGIPLFPFGRPPYLPFIAWATRSGRAWASPVGMLVHDRDGLMISIRGAIALPTHVDLPATGARPCDTCDQPCRTACPVNALATDRYDVAACHGFLDKHAGQDCMRQGCAARRACPISAASGRLTAQSAYHMRQFHP